MANRSYLYSTNDVPGSQAWTAKRALRGVAEFRSDIPLVFKILLCGNPVACRSSIWDSAESIAIIGDYALGVDRLTRYLSRVTDDVARPLIDEALAFLRAPNQVRSHLILECGEIFDLMGGSPAERNTTLLKELLVIGQSVDDLPLPQPVTGKQGVLSRLLKLPKPDALDPYYEIGLGSWSEILYFDFGETEG